jgi:hypothetical protein
MAFAFLVPLRLIIGSGGTMQKLISLVFGSGSSGANLLDESGAPNDAAIVAVSQERSWAEKKPNMQLLPYVRFFVAAVGKRGRARDVQGPFWGDCLFGRSKDASTPPRSSTAYRYMHAIKNMKMTYSRLMGSETGKGMLANYKKKLALSKERSAGEDGRSEEGQAAGGAGGTSKPPSQAAGTGTLRGSGKRAEKATMQSTIVNTMVAHTEMVKSLTGKQLIDELVSYWILTRFPQLCVCVCACCACRVCPQPEFRSGC